MSQKESPLMAAGAAYFEGLYARFLEDPAAVDPSFRVVFEVLRDLGADEPAAAALRSRGHLRADINPLLRLPVPGDRPSQAWCGQLTAETAHIDNDGVRRWLCEAMEAGNDRPDGATRVAALRQLVAAEQFERFLAVKTPGKKRFGSDGAEMMVPLLRRIIDQAAAAGITDVIIGAMHRGRLNLMTGVLGEPLVVHLAKFFGAHPFPAAPGISADVPYHLGYDAVVETPSGPVTVTLCPNPSHLEAINPVALGRVRARQDAAAGQGRSVLALNLHTDASVIGQGSVAELIQLSGLSGYSVGGTIHVVINNQLGFTTEPGEARTSHHCTGAWKAIDSAILHVNGNEPDAVLRAADIAVGFRMAQRRDAVIDFVCYRRNGHNEIDEPRYTQPLLYQVIDAMAPVGGVFARQLAEEGLISQSDIDAHVAQYWERLEQSYQAAKSYRPNITDLPAAPPRGGNPEPATGVAPDRLTALLRILATPPAGMALDPRMQRLLRQRLDGLKTGLPWATAEALAFGTLLEGGVPVRLTGQDVMRGAFSHRHFAVTDIETGRRHVSLQNIAGGQAQFDIVNSPLSEYAVLGFEYGYSIERPEGLTIWEAQFGDFANGAQIIIDHFITNGEEKWLIPSGLVVLLPHGLEGQGPEHSSARIERLLDMAAGENIQIANPSTPANYFHLLRRQALRLPRKPLFVTSPKTLLRLPAAVSMLEDFGEGTGFAPVLASAPGPEITRVLLCSGKIAYDLEAKRDASGDLATAVVRLEMIYPFPGAALAAVLRRWPAARFAWVQEEPENMGAWRNLDRPLETLLAAIGARQTRFACISRPESPSAAGSFHADHERDQRRIVAQALEIQDGAE